MNSVNEAMALKSIADAFAIEADAICKEASSIDFSVILNAAELLISASRIGASGCGHSGIACRHFAHLMCCIDHPARFLSPSEANHGAMGFLASGDVMLLNSRGGKTDELIPLAKICRQKGVSIITMTENAESPLAEMADIVIPLVITRETDRYNCQGTASFIVQCAVFDAIQTAIIELTGFENRDFAINHPGGAVGCRLSSESRSLRN